MNQGSDDRRVYAVRITPAGQAVLNKANLLIEQHDRQLLACLTEPERVTLKSLLGRLVKDLPAARESP